MSIPIINREEYERNSQLMRRIGDKIKADLPKGWGFVLIAAPTNTDIFDGGQWVSDLEREGAIKIVRQTLERVEKNLRKRQ